MVEDEITDPLTLATPTLTSPINPVNDGGYSATPIYSIDSPTEWEDTAHVTKRGETIRDLKRELVEVTRRASQLTQAIRVLEELEKHGGGGQETGEKQKKGAAPLVRMTHPEAARAVLEKAKHPLTIREILNALTEQGRPVTTSKPYRTMYKVLRDNPAFARADDSKWRLS